VPGFLVWARCWRMAALARAVCSQGQNEGVMDQWFCPYEGF
jgi:hypothetical protein